MSDRREGPRVAARVVSDFDQFPGAQKRLRVKLPDDILDEPAYRSWFIRPDDAPMACLEAVGLAWTNRGEPCDLMALYKRERRIWPVVTAVAGQLLP